MIISLSPVLVVIDRGGGIVFNRFTSGLPSLFGEYKMNKFTAIYMRISTSQQTTRGQKADLKRWLDAQEKNGRVVWFEDKATGKNMDRPGWNKLQAGIDQGEVDRLIVWRLDRLGRTASGLCKLFEDLQAQKVG